MIMEWKNGILESGIESNGENTHENKLGIGASKFQ